MKMNDPVALQEVESALEEFLFNAQTPDDGITVLLKNPNLITSFIEEIFDDLIADADNEGDNILKDFYKSRLELLHILKSKLSKQDIILLHTAKQLTKQVLIENDSKEIFSKIVKWLRTPTLEKRIKILQKNPELLTDKTEKFFTNLIERANSSGELMSVKILRSINEIFRMLRLDLNNKTDNIEDIKAAIELSLDKTDFSIFTEGYQSVYFVA
ncbi:queuosine salvage family protein [Candidatus Marithrix sp. Canyon 246]|uniref:queuosine salvage family protein n=1 Tax=Candidatus Marithrix sp. Canyon 246 TaxID=1827136 RepID=UPI00084A1344|nr:queuosine salvage family protein [Candidatus Marithrix sp. Canyon 246]